MCGCHEVVSKWSGSSQVNAAKYIDIDDVILCADIIGKKMLRITSRKKSHTHILL